MVKAARKNGSKRAHLRPAFKSQAKQDIGNVEVALAASHRSILALCFAMEPPGQSYAQRKVRRECLESLRIGPEYTDVKELKGPGDKVATRLEVGRRAVNGTFLPLKTASPRLHSVSQEVAKYALDMLGRSGHHVNAEGVVLDVEEIMAAVVDGSYITPERVPAAGEGEEYGEPEGEVAEAK